MVSLLVRKIISKHERDIRTMQRALFTDAGERLGTDPALTDAQMRKLARTRARSLPHVRGRSLTNRRAEVSVIMDRGPATQLEPDAGVDPTLTLVSVSENGSNLFVGNSEILDTDEYTAWAQAAVGETWASRLYADGALSGNVFTDQAGHAVDKPAGWSLPLEPVAA